MGARTKTLILPTLLAAVVLAGCGSSSLSNSQLESQVSRICTTTETVTNRIATPGSPAASAEFLERGATALTPELTALQAVHPPNDVADVYGATVGSFQQKIRELHATARAIERGADPIKALQHLQQRLGPLESQENDGWQALQLPACVSR
jgi:hypothetical protein